MRIAERTTPGVVAGGRRLSLASRRSRRRSSLASGLDLTGGLLRDDDDGTADLPVILPASRSNWALPRIGEFWSFWLKGLTAFSVLMATAARACWCARTKHAASQFF